MSPSLPSPLSYDSPSLYTPSLYPSLSLSHTLSTHRLCLSLSHCHSLTHSLYTPILPLFPLSVPISLLSLSLLHLPVSPAFTPLCTPLYLILSPSHTLYLPPFYFFLSLSPLDTLLHYLSMPPLFLPLSPSHILTHLLSLPPFFIFLSLPLTLSHPINFGTLQGNACKEKTCP
jgi:hypothetical protein